ncbi:RDD family protein [Streptomyces sp. V3I7]|uniref:RDD family protein n=1 Tax=Streptomyces sp. V3I7 TaxID=3042278 RepID=UPI002782E4FB|nr:RDD family protein [Streptomyces sp. V3I7]MDQ0991166.1 putative RDD family membrane protein YckC [Streptomyces sp. V3I7]
MSTEPPPGSGQQPPDDDPFRKQPPQGPGAGSPYDTPYGGQGGQHPPYGPGGYPADPLAGMPPLANSVKRTIARIIDMILVAIVVWLVTWAFGVAEYEMDSDRIDTGKSIAQSVIVAVLYVAYDTVLTAKWGQTLGKRWMGMRVANLDNGATPSWQTSLIRALVLWIPFAFCCACIWTAIAGGWSYFDRPYKQGLDDKAAKTVVVSTS